MPKRRSDDPFDTPEWREYAQHARESLEPMVRDSAVTISLYSGKVDPKMAMEMGYMILLDKPIIAVVDPGCQVPAKLMAVADEIVEGHVSDPDFQERLHAAMKRVTDKLKPDD